MTVPADRNSASSTADGETLAAVLRREPDGLGSARATHLVVQVLAALARVHAQGLVHGDVRPANVLVSGAGRNEVARLREPGGDRDAARAAGPAADVWAAGILFHEMLCGRPPPGRPGHEFTPSQLDADLPVSIAAALSGALRPDPARRLDCAALLALLQADPASAPEVIPTAPPPARAVRPGKLLAPEGFVKPQPWDSEVSTLVALLLVAVAAILAPACLS